MMAGTMMEGTMTASAIRQRVGLRSYAILPRRSQQQLLWSRTRPLSPRGLPCFTDSTEKSFLAAVNNSRTLGELRRYMA
jgi:hypothetical protein